MAPVVRWHRWFGGTGGFGGPGSLSGGLTGGIDGTGGSGGDVTGGAGISGGTGAPVVVLPVVRWFHWWFGGTFGGVTGGSVVPSVVPPVVSVVAVAQTVTIYIYIYIYIYTTIHRFVIFLQTKLTFKVEMLALSLAKSTISCLTLSSESMVMPVETVEPIARKSTIDAFLYFLISFISLLEPYLCVL